MKISCMYFERTTIPTKIPMALYIAIIHYLLSDRVATLMETRDILQVLLETPRFLENISVSAGKLLEIIDLICYFIFYFVKNL